MLTHLPQRPGRGPVPAQAHRGRADAAAHRVDRVAQELAGPVPGLGAEPVQQAAGDLRRHLVHQPGLGRGVQAAEQVLDLPVLQLPDQVRLLPRLHVREHADRGVLLQEAEQDGDLVRVAAVQELEDVTGREPAELLHRLVEPAPPQQGAETVLGELGQARRGRMEARVRRTVRPGRGDAALLLTERGGVAAAVLVCHRLSRGRSGGRR